MEGRRKVVVYYMFSIKFVKNVFSVLILSWLMMFYTHVCYTSLLTTGIYYFTNKGFGTEAH